MGTPLLSIIICTHNRAELARLAIESVLIQDISQNEYEVLVIDTSSTNETRSMVQEFSDTHSNVRYVLEPIAGLSHARNRGWQEARGDYVGYLDDDGKASQDWLKAALRVVTQIQPEAFGGPYYAYYNRAKPFWYKDEYGSSVQGTVARPLKENEYISGGNMFIRRDILEQLGGFDASLGIWYGEETNFFVRLRIANERAVIYYDPDVFILHLVHPGKYSIVNFLRGRLTAGKQNHIMLVDPKDPAPIFNILMIFGELVRILKSFFWDALWRDRRMYPYVQNHIYEITSAYIFRLGYRIESLRAAIKVFRV